MTLPDEFRKVMEWLNPESVISLSSNSANEIVIRPYVKKQKSDWNNVLDMMKKARSVKGRGKGNLSAFIAKDRLNHF